ncbi:RelA/SpoT domain-containing protein [uncultured Pontibacter sp.]|uniref:RelA/SpoT domain-containing protein n=1 Tax=uncultured Pontibacter sp. TaxID=453356 RepID=UPI0026317DB3|nr:RelA/SpoT domain-containing protein [uncultured Pontibacter sp.]
MRPSNHVHKAALPFILSLLDVSKEQLYAQGIDAQELVVIYNDYTTRLDELEDLAILVATNLKRQENVHALRYRVKEPLHLLKKIIRKKEEYPDRHLNSGNYLQYINDLVGVRILHLYKEDCTAIGDFIKQHWELKREPYAYVDDKRTSEAIKFTSGKYKVLVNDRGYKAQHFILKVKPSRQQYFVEVQVKTLFEEGWSEVDHCIRYPDHKPNTLLNRLLWLLNELTANADAVATQIQALAEELHKYQHNPKITTAQLRSHIDMLPVDEQEKQFLYTCLAKLTDSEKP